MISREVGGDKQRNGPLPHGKGPSSVEVRLLRLAAVGQRRQEEERHDIGDLDHRVHGRARSILVGIPHGITGHGSFMGL